MQKNKKVIPKGKPKKKPVITKRSKKRFPALDKTLNLKTRSDLLDFDYISKLNDKEKAWLNKFVEETVHAIFPAKERGKIKVNKKTGKKTKSKTVYNTSAALVKTKKQRKNIYDSNNARNRCIYTRSKAQGKLDYTEDLKLAMEDELIEGTEDQIIDKIDNDSFIEEQINTELLVEKLEDFDNTGSDTDNDGQNSH